MYIFQTSASLCRKVKEVFVEGERELKEKKEIKKRNYRGNEKRNKNKNRKTKDSLLSQVGTKDELGFGIKKERKSEWEERKVGSYKRLHSIL